MSEEWEVVVKFQKEENAQRVAKYLSNRFPLRVSVRKLNPDAHPVADAEQE